MVSLLKSALKNKIFWYLASRYGTFAIQFLTSIWLAVKLGPYYFGLWSFILLLINIGQQFNWGIGNAVNILLVQNKQDVVLRRKLESTSFWITLAICSLPFVIVVYDCIRPIPLLAKYEVGHRVSIVALIISLQYLIQLFINVFRVKNRLLEIAVCQSLFPVLTFLAIFLADGEGLLSLLLWLYASSALIGLGLFVRAKQFAFAGGFDLGICSCIIRKGVFLFAYNAGFFLIMLTTKTLVSAHYPVAEFGQFAFAFNVANATVLLIDSLMFLLFPKMIDLMHRGGREAVIAQLGEMRRCYIFIMGVLFCLMLVGYHVLMVFAPRYRDSNSIFVSLAVTMLVYTWCFGYNIYLLAKNHEASMASFALMALGLNVALGILFINVFHVPIVLSLAGTVLSYLVYVLVVNVVARRSLGLRVSLAGLIPLHMLVPMALLSVCAFHDSIWLAVLAFCGLVLLNRDVAATCLRMMSLLIVRPKIMDL